MRKLKKQTEGVVPKSEVEEPAFVEPSVVNTEVVEVAEEPAEVKEPQPPVNQTPPYPGLPPNPHDSLQSYSSEPLYQQRVSGC